MLAEDEPDRLVVIREGGEFSPAFRQQMKRAAASGAVLPLKPYMEKFTEIASQPDTVGGGVDLAPCAGC